MVKRWSKVDVKEGRETIFIETIGYARGSFQDDVRKFANGLLNSHGGVVYFGVDSSGVARGKTISRKEEDELRLAVDHAIGGQQPFISSQHYRLTFLPLANCNYSIIELKVSVGELGEIYEDGMLKVYIVDSKKLIGPLHPQELKELILLKYKQSIEGAEEAAKYCTPNLLRAKTISRTAKKSASMATIPELPVTEESLQRKEKLPVVTITRTNSSACIVPRTPLLKRSASSIPSSNQIKTSVLIGSGKRSTTSIISVPSTSNINTSSVAAGARGVLSDATNVVSGQTKPKASNTLVSVQASTSKRPAPIQQRTSPCKQPKVHATVRRTQSVCRTPVYRSPSLNKVVSYQYNSTRSLPDVRPPVHYGGTPLYSCYGQAPPPAPLMRQYHAPQYGRPPPLMGDRDLVDYSGFF